MIHVDIPDNVTVHTMVDFVCDVCGGKGRIRYDHYKHGIGCGYCANKKVLPGFNDIATTSEAIIPWLKNPDDAHKYTRKSHHKLDLICPECKYEFKRIVADATGRGLKCPHCSGSISYPNRIMETLLKILGVDFQREVGFPWSSNKRYDFFIRDFNMIIEMHGAQHYAGFIGDVFEVSLKDIQDNDRFKQDIAINNGIKEYIVIDSCLSEIEHIKSSIMQSKLRDYFDLSKVNWLEIEMEANKGYWAAFVSAYKSGKSVPEISKEFKRSSTFVSRILKEATSAGECDYSASDQILKAQQIAASMHRKPIICVTTNTLFDSLNTACEYYGINDKALSRHLTGHTKSSGTLNGQRLEWKYALE